MLNLETLHPHKQIVPERNLLVAMLHRALLDYYGTRPADKQEAATWLFDEGDERDAFTFRWVCAQLDLSPTEIRSRVKRSGVDKQHLSAVEMWGMRRTA